ncbi:putative acyl-protein thioesterase 1 [Cladorrhinum sp. PSN332]|nr:putative acyl-protein thioesterase 1 [Cladorrhinum sp. PSN332]
MTHSPLQPLITIPPKRGGNVFLTGWRRRRKHTHTLIFLHGRGDSTNNFMRALERWRTTGQSRGRKKDIRKAFPTLRIVFPQAPSRKIAAEPASQDARPQWFDVWDSTKPALNPEVQIPGLQHSIPLLEALIRHEASLLGNDTTKIIIAGFSMGGGTCAHLLFNLPCALGAFVGLSCRLPFVSPERKTMADYREVLGLGLTTTSSAADKAEGAEAVKRTPVLLEHCADDPLVTVQMGREMRDALRQLGFEKVEWREYEDGGHELKHGQGVDDFVEFLGRVLFDKGEEGEGRRNDEKMENN